MWQFEKESIFTNKLSTPKLKKEAIIWKEEIDLWAPTSRVDE